MDYPSVFWVVQLGCPYCIIVLSYAPYPRVIHMAIRYRADRIFRFPTQLRITQAYTRPYSRELANVYLLRHFPEHRRVDKE